MPRFTQTRAEWLAVADELAGRHRAAAPPGLEERVRALLRGVPAGWPDQPATLDLDEGGAAAVRAVLAGLAGRDPAAGQRSASVVEAEAIVRDGQRGRGRDTTGAVDTRDRGTVVGRTGPMGEANRPGNEPSAAEDEPEAPPPAPGPADEAETPRPIVPGNVGSLDDVPPDVEGTPVAEG